MIAVDTFSLYDQQKDAVNFMAARGGRAGLFGNMGSGKTRTSLAYISQVAHRVVIVAEITYIYVWEREIRTCLPDAEMLVLAGSGSTVQQAATLKAWARSSAKRNTNLCVIIVNYDSFWRGELRKAILSWKPDGIIADEVQRLQDRRTRRSKFAHELADRFPNAYRLGLSGTPTGARLNKAFVATGKAKARLHRLFSIFRFIDPALFGTRWADFERDYCSIGGFHIRLITGYHNVDDLERKVRGAAAFMDRPPLTVTAKDVIVPVVLNKIAMNKYQELKKYSITRIDGTDEDGKPLSGTVLSRVTIALTTKLQQLTSGAVKTQEGIIDFGNDKLTACRTLIEDAIDETNVVVACRYRRDVARLSAAIQALGLTVVNIQGGMQRKERDAALKTFSTNDHVVLVGNERAMSLGIDLTAGCIAILYSLDYSPDTLVQFCDRLHRPGQARDCIFFHLVAKDTIDENVLSALQSGIDISVKARDIDFARSLLK